MKKTVIAVFEDDSVNRFIYQRLFSQHEQKVDLHIFETMEKGLEKSKEVQFDVVYIEVHFRETFGGIRILNSLKQAVDHPVIFVAVSPFLQPGDLEYILSCGFHMCVEKSAAFAELPHRDIL